MVGLNLSNSVDVPTLLADADVRRGLGLEDDVRFEHHVTETARSIVRQPYDRRADIVAAVNWCQWSEWCAVSPTVLILNLVS